MNKEEFLKHCIHIEEPSPRFADKAYELGVSAIEADVAEFLQFFLKGLHKEHILEVGSGVGYSAAFFRSLYPYANIVSIDRVQRRHEVCIENVPDVTFVLADGTEFLSEYREPIDLFFLDAAKGQYLAMLKACESNFTSDILIIADNIFSRGKSYEDINHRHRTLVRRMREFLEYMDQNYEMTILDIGDGLLLARRKEMKWNY